MLARSRELLADAQRCAGVDIMNSGMDATPFELAPEQDINYGLAIYFVLFILIGTVSDPISMCDSCPLDLCCCAVLHHEHFYRRIMQLLWGGQRLAAAHRQPAAVVADAGAVPRSEAESGSAPDRRGEKGSLSARAESDVWQRHERLDRGQRRDPDGRTSSSRP